ncbi:MAG: YerC/YecD family TrpR-related protein [Pseudomonadota bacterium]
MKPNKPISQRQQAAAEKDLASAIASMNNPSNILLFLKDLCTPAELQALVDRWQVVKMLRQGLAYREINKRTGVSVTTVGRVARYLADGHGGYLRALEKQL